MTNLIVSTALTASLLFSQPTMVSPVAGNAGQLVQNQVLASETMDLSYRYPVKSVSDGFSENIFIALGYLAFQGDALEAQAGEFAFVLVLNPGEVFAFHKNILPEFKQDKIITQESGFLKKEGYVSVAGLQGNGVCHLASLMNFVATGAGLEVTAPMNHNFAQIPGIDRKYGTSIYYLPKGGGISQRQNLYIRNNREYPVELRFSLAENLLTFSVLSVL